MNNVGERDNQVKEKLKSIKGTIGEIKKLSSISPQGVDVGYARRLRTKEIMQEVENLMKNSYGIEN